MDSVDAADNRRDAIVGVTIAFLSLSWIAVLLRTYVRAFMMRNYGWDDAVMLLAVITYTMYCSFNFLCVSYGFGNANVLLASPETLAKLASYLLACFSLYAATMVILKISLGIFYLRIAVEKWQRWTVYITVGISTIFGTYYFFAAIFQCGNPTHFLQNAVMGKCPQDNATLFGVNMTAGVINAVSDFILAVLPISLIRKAAMPTPAKISACLVLLLGSVGSAVSVVRLTFIRGLTYGGNFFESGVNITIWSEVEAGICIVAVSMITLRPLFRCCMDNTRRAITPSLGYSAARKKKQSGLSSTENSTNPGTHERPERPAQREPPVRPKRPSSPMSFMDVGGHHSRNHSRNPSRRNSAGWSQIPEEKNPEEQLLDRIESNTTRRASLHHGKVHWKEERIAAPPAMPPVPRNFVMSAVPQNSPARTPNASPPESPILPPSFKSPLPPSFKSPPTRPSRSSRPFNMPKIKSPTWPKSPSWPKPPSWPKSPRHREMPPPLNHVVSQWKPPNQRPESMRSDSGNNVHSTYPSGMTFGRGQLGPYESYYGGPNLEGGTPYDLTGYTEPYVPAVPAQYAEQATLHTAIARPQYADVRESGAQDWRPTVVPARESSIARPFRETSSPQPVYVPPEREHSGWDERRYRRRGFAERPSYQPEEIGLGVWKMPRN